jgi:hypothetical protein
MRSRDHVSAPDSKHLNRTDVYFRPGQGHDACISVLIVGPSQPIPAYSGRITLFSEYRPVDCPTGEAQSVQLEWLPFENGAMLLDASQGVIYAFFDDGTVETFDNTFVPDDAEQDPSLQPPDSLYQPSGPLGIAWRESQAARDKLGWATMPDSRKYDGLKQEMLDKGTIVFAMGNGDLVGLFPFSDNWSRLPVDTIPNYYGGIPGTPVTGVAVFSTFGLLVAVGLIVTRRRMEG